MRIKIHGGTATGGSPLCHSCRYATVIRGTRLKDEIVECRVTDRRIYFTVTSCTQFSNRNEPSIREMEEMAWVLRSDARKKTVGFVPSKRLKDEERFVLEED